MLKGPYLNQQTEFGDAIRNVLAPTTKRSRQHKEKRRKFVLHIAT
jgi:hypothetical protein